MFEESAATAVLLARNATDAAAEVPINVLLFMNFKIGFFITIKYNSFRFIKWK
jgi:hypothetical protein